MTTTPSAAGGGDGFRRLNRYQQANAREKVYGYIVSRKDAATAEEHFERAKAECLMRLGEQIEQIRSMGFSDFATKTTGASQ